MSEEMLGWMTSSHLLARVAGAFGAARRRSRERAMLALVDDRDLRDVGLSRATVAFELNRPFWRR